MELRFLLQEKSLRPVLTRLDTSLSLEVSLPEHCLIPLLFKIDHLVRSQFHAQLEPNLDIRHKEMFRLYWKKMID